MEIWEPTWRDLDVPRALSEGERQLAETLAAATGEDDLVAQVRRAHVAADCGCGCSSVRLAGDGPAVGPDVVRRLSSNDRDDYVCVSADVAGGTDGEPASVTLHVVGGLVHELELFAGEGVPMTPPAVDRLRRITVS